MGKDAANVGEEADEEEQDQVESPKSPKQGKSQGKKEKGKDKEKHRKADKREGTKKRKAFVDWSKPKENPTEPMELFVHGELHVDVWRQLYQEWEAKAAVVWTVGCGTPPARWRAGGGAGVGSHGGRPAQ
jgi:hypothetical protein